MHLGKKTKIICTIGPATETEAKLTELLKVGMNVMRLNFSHGDFAEHQARVNNLHAAVKKTGIPAAILQDLSGPKIRIGDFKTDTGRVTLKPGQFFTLTTKQIEGNESKVHVNYPLLPKEVKVGGFILLDDGKKKLQIVDIKGDEVKCKVLVGGETKGRRGVNLPGAYLSISSITEKDRKDLAFGVKNKVDYIALSFVRRAEDVIELRALLDKAKSKAGIIAKIETPEAVENIDKIIELSDGIMVARGDLAIEVPAENVPMIQKMIIRKCNEAAKPVITATQMLESMIKNPVPTRAEVSDVANAILDGTDAIMLSEETTLGEHPIEAVQVMTRVSTRVENEHLHKQLLNGDIAGKVKGVGESVTASVAKTAERIGARYIVTLTNTGYSARMISRYKSNHHILVFTPNKETFQKSLLYFGCDPFLVPKSNDFVGTIKSIKQSIVKNKLANKGDKIVVATGTPFGKIGYTNMMLVDVI
ncbi:MAG: pyruvate kinase [Candidatus Pacebacteria bacterium]|nr:pyruvate kinase [Candidatus Paceibacterota bacterium]